MRGELLHLGQQECVRLGEKCHLIFFVKPGVLETKHYIKSDFFFVQFCTFWKANTFLKAEQNKILRGSIL